jgi:hypothetical protein
MHLILFFVGAIFSLIAAVAIVGFILRFWWQILLAIGALVLLVGIIASQPDKVVPAPRPQTTIETWEKLPDIKTPAPVKKLPRKNTQGRHK